MHVSRNRLWVLTRMADFFSSHGPSLPAELQASERLVWSGRARERVALTRGIPNQQASDSPATSCADLAPPAPPRRLLITHFSVNRPSKSVPASNYRCERCTINAPLLVCLIPHWHKYACTNHLLICKSPVLPMSFFVLAMNSAITFRLEIPNAIDSKNQKFRSVVEDMLI